MKSIDRLSFLARQIGTLLENGESLDDALYKVEKQSLSADEKEIKMLRFLFETTDENIILPSEFKIYSIFNALLNSVKKAGGNVNDLFIYFNKLFIQPTQDGEYRVLDVSGLFVYLLSIIVVATVSVVIYSIFVFPEFENLFANFGVELPRFTQSVLGLFNAFLYPIIIVVVILMGGGFIILYAIKNSIHNARFISSFIVRLPFISDVLNKYNQHLTLRFLSLLLNSNISSKMAVDIFEELFGEELKKNNSGICGLSTQDELENILVAAYELGTFNQEVQYQLEQVQYEGVVSFSVAKGKISVFAIILVALTVGSLIIAMYLPIFQLGKIIGG